SAFVITVSGTFSLSSRVISGCCPIPSRMTFPPPNTTSSPYFVKSFSTSINKSVSAKRTESPVVGPYIWAYCSLDILKLILHPRLLMVRLLYYENHKLLVFLHNQLILLLIHHPAQIELPHSHERSGFCHRSLHVEF